jgi:tape measure domain-containing protein
MATKQIPAYKLGVQIEADDKKATPVLQNVEKQTVKNVNAFKSLGTQIKAALGGDVTAGKELGIKIGSDMVGGIKDTLSNLGQKIGGVIGTAVAPGIGTAIGTAVGTAIDTALEKVSGPILEKITQGLGLNEQLELANVHFTAITGSSSKAYDHIAALKKLSVSAGLDLPMLLTASGRLEEFNKDIRTTKVELQAAADQSARFGTGVEGFNAIANALGMVALKGELSSKTLLKLYKQGIDAPKLLAQATGKSVKQIKALIKQGRIEGEPAARMIAEGIERQSGGYAQNLADNTGFGRKARFAAQTSVLAAKGTENLYKEQSNAYGTANQLLGSEGADKFVGFINDMVGKISGAVHKGLELGVDLTTGLAKGIQSGEAIQSLTGAVSGMADSAIGSIKGALGIESPSKVFAQFGAYVVDGFAFGKDGKGGIASQESKEKLRQALEDLLSDPNIQALLYAIKKGEGGKPNVMAGGRIVNSGALHPGEVVPMSQWFRGDKGPSSAAGNYQITRTNWRTIAPKLGLDNFSDPKQQALAALYLFSQHDKGAGIRAAQSGNLAGMEAIARLDWTSVPGSKIGGGGQVNAKRWAGYYNEGLQLAANGGAISNSNPMPVSVVGDLSGGADSFKPGRGKFASFDAGAGSYEAMRTGPRVDVTLGAFHLAQNVLPPMLKAENSLRNIAGMVPDMVTNMASVMPPVIASLSDVAPLIKTALKTTRAESELTKEQLKANYHELAGSLSQQLGRTLQSVLGFLPSGGGQVGKKRGLFSKILGFAAPFLSFIPGAGPILSTIAGAASNALVGNWQGVAQGLTSGATGMGFLDKHFGGSSGGDPSGGEPEPKALGGRVRRGHLYRVGEIRDEFFVPGQDGQIYPSRSSFNSSRGGDDGMQGLMERMHQTLNRLQSVPFNHVVRMGAAGLFDAMDNNAGLQDGFGRRLSLG